MESRTYEGLFLLDPTQINQEWDKVKNEVVAMLERRDGNIINAKKWGERKLAYEIKGHRRGTYLLVYFQMPPENLSVLQRDFQLSELVLRNLIIVYKRPIEETEPEEESAETKEEETETAEEKKEEEASSDEDSQEEEKAEEES